ncbi:MAG TPA: DUF4129 domain-containing protein [Ktedonobacteraceae bacterium]|nr:DUF4129 domain-containing protein [Ktedonobacteraceae bacterium]
MNFLRPSANRSRPPTTSPARQSATTPASAPVQPAFSWVEQVIIPVTASLMETQPIFLVLLFFASAFQGENASALLDPVSITLLMLGLQWWAMLVYYLVQQRNLGTEWMEVLHVLGLCLAFALALVTHWQLLNNILALVVVAGLLIWLWRRGIRLSRLERRDEYLITSFKIGFIVLLIVLVLTALYFGSFYQYGLSYTALHEAVGRGLLIYFLSGVLCLSFTRISFIRRENVYRVSGKATGDPTRLWLVILTLFWSVITVAAFALETFSFSIVTGIMTDFWNELGLLVGWLIGLLTPLLNFLLKLLAPIFAPMPGRAVPVVPLPSANQHHTPSPPLPADVVNFLRLLLLLALLVVVVLVIRAILRRLRLHIDDESEEERESLSMQSVLRERLGERRKARQKDEAVMLEPLPPDSARARYRELLQALSDQGAALAHRPDETPAEYEARLLALDAKIKQRSLEVGAQEKGSSSDAALLDELTTAYAQERYGEKRARIARNADVSAWIARFVKRLSGS